jgi:hypothetical protein
MHHSRGQCKSWPLSKGNVMKKNISLAHSLLLLPLIAPSALLSMEESMIVIPEPKTRGLGIIRSSFDLIWSEEENLYNDLRTKTFDVENSSYHHKLDTAIQIYVTKQNSQRIAEIVDLCRQNYPRQVEIGDGQARMAHKLLTEENKNRQIILKNTIEANDKKFIDNYNTSLKELQSHVTEKINTMQIMLNQYIEERNTVVKEKGDEIRVLKKALVNLHHLNKTFILLEDKEINGYCSDDEKNVNNVDNSYNDEHLLAKNSINYGMTQTKTNTENTLKRLYEINIDITDINPIQYKS